MDNDMITSLHEFVSENWDVFEIFCKEKDIDAEDIMQQIELIVDGT